MKTKTKIKLDTTSTEELLVCPICGETFEPNDDTKYIACGGYTCSWECFSDEAKRQEARKKEKIKKKI